MPRRPLIGVAAIAVAISSYSASAQQLWVGDSTTSAVYAYDLSTIQYDHTVIGQGSGGLNAVNGIALKGDYLFASSAGDRQIMRYKAATAEPAPSVGQLGAVFATNVCNAGLYYSQPIFLRVGPDGNLYTDCDGGGAVERYDADTGQPLPSANYSGTYATFAAVGQTAGFDFGPDGNLYVGNFVYTASVWRFNGTTGEFMDVFIPETLTGARIANVTWGPDGNVYVSGRPWSGQPGAIWRFTSSGTPLPAPGHSEAVFSELRLIPGEVRFGPDGFLYSTSWNYLGDTAIFKIDPTTGATVADVDGQMLASGNRAPSGLAFTNGTPPAITSLTSTPNTLWPPNGQMVGATFRVTATGSPSPECHVSAVSSNEASAIPGQPQWSVTGALTANLRAERLGTGTGRAYTVTVQCANAAGSTTKAVKVTVPHDQK